MATLDLDNNDGTPKNFEAWEGLVPSKNVAPARGLTNPS